MKVEKAREVRLWIVQVIAPLGIGAAFLWNQCPGFQHFCKNSYNKVTTKVKKVFKKDESYKIPKQSGPVPYGQENKDES